MFVGHREIRALRIMEGTQDDHTARLQNLLQGLWSSAPFCLSSLTSHTALLTPFVPTTGSLHFLECSPSLYIRAFLLPESLCPHVFIWRTQTFDRNLHVTTSTMSANSPGEATTALHSHSALLLILSQHFPHRLPVISHRLTSPFPIGCVCPVGVPSRESS